MNHDCQLTSGAEAEFQKAVRDLFQHYRKGHEDADIQRNLRSSRDFWVNESISSWMILALFALPFFVGIWFGLSGENIVGMMILLPIVAALAFKRMGLFSGQLALYPPSLRSLETEHIAYHGYERLSPAEIEELAQLTIGHDPSAAVLDAWMKDGMPLRKRDAMALRRFANAHEKYRSRLDLAENFHAAAARGRVVYASRFS